MNSYTSLEARLHDAFWSEEGEPAELPLLEDTLQEYPGPSLEIGCGSGRLLLPLLQKGHGVEGLELSSEMLDLCRQEAAARGLKPVLHEGDMTAFDPGKTYTSVLVPAFTLQLAADPSAALRHFHKLLIPGGVLYLSVFIPMAELHRELPEGEWHDDHHAELPGGKTATVRTRHRLDRKARILTREHRYLLSGPDGAPEEEHESEQVIRWFTARQLRGMLAKAGFEPLHAVADFDPACPVEEDSQVLTVVALKTA